MSQSIYVDFRLWQSEATGAAVFEQEKMHVAKMVERLHPKLVVQIEGRALLDHYPDDQYYYHVSEDANVHAVGYTVEAEQGFLPFPDQSVDLLIIGHALELYQNHQSLFIEVERVLSPNGRVFMATLANYWLGTLPKHYHPLGDLRVAPQPMRKIKRWLDASDLAIVAEHSLISDHKVMMSERLKETIIRPIGLEIQRVVPQWAGMAGAVK